MRRKQHWFFNKRTEKIMIITACLLVFLLIVAFFLERKISRQGYQQETSSDSVIDSIPAAVTEIPEVEPEAVPDEVTSVEVTLDPTWNYAGFSAISTGSAVLWGAKPSIANGKTICINAGHGTSGGSSVKTQCHPDGTPKVTGGTTEEGASTAVAVSTGTEMKDGSSEADANLTAARAVRDVLLENGYNVLMIRDSEDVQLDNIARTVLANHYADAHIAIHYDYTDNDKGIFFMSVPSSGSYRSMEPVASHYTEHNALGRAVVSAIAAEGFSLFDGGELEMDLTQTSYSEIPSIDLEIGDTASDYSIERSMKIANGILAGLNQFFAG